MRHREDGHPERAGRGQVGYGDKMRRVEGQMWCGGGRVEGLLVKWTGNEISNGVPHLSQATSHTINAVILKRTFPQCN